MGEIAEGLIDGTFDYITGEYIGEGFGFPRTLEQRTRPKNPHFGLCNYLNKKGFTNHNKIIKDYCLLNNITKKHTQKRAWEIQKDFQKFARYVSTLNK